MFTFHDDFLFNLLEFTNKTALWPFIHLRQWIVSTLDDPKLSDCQRWVLFKNSGFKTESQTDEILLSSCKWFKPNLLFSGVFNKNSATGFAQAHL